MTGANESRSSGSKRKSDSESVGSSDFPLVRPNGNGRDKTKKKGMRSLLLVQGQIDELKKSNRDDEKRAKEEELVLWTRSKEVMAEYERVKKMEMFWRLKTKPFRDDLDENTLPMEPNFHFRSFEDMQKGWREQEKMLRIEVGLLEEMLQLQINSLKRKCRRRLVHAKNALWFMLRNRTK